MNNSPNEERINILMVDDSPTNLLALDSILRGPDRNLIPISSGKDALRYLLDNEAAVVLLDVYMPGIDGFETAQLIRGREKSRETPIIFLTANSTGVSHLSRGYSLGAVDYIVKPVDADILRSKVAVFVELFKKNLEIKQQADLHRLWVERIRHILRRPLKDPHPFTKVIEQAYPWRDKNYVLP